MNTILRQTVWTALAIALCDATAHASSYRVLARTGDAASQTTATFEGFGSPVINASGEVAFQSFLSGPTTDVVPHGDFVVTAQGAGAFAVSGQAADGGNGARFRTPGPPIILTADRQTLFYGNMVEELGVTWETSYGIWAGPPNGVQSIARSGGPVPGMPPEVNYSMIQARPHASGQLGLTAMLQGDGIDISNSIVSFLGPLTPASGLTLVARAGDAAPGLAVGSKFHGLGAPAVNAHGQYVLGGLATDGVASGLYVPGIWGSNGGELQLLVSAQSAVPGAPERKFSSFYEPGFNRQGDAAFQASLVVESEEQRFSENGIWIGNVDFSALLAIAVEGSSAHEFSPSAVFRGSAPGEEPYYAPFTNPVLGGSGHVAFAATVAGEGIDFDHNDGIWVSSPTGSGETRTRIVLAREGEAAPGAPEGTVFLGKNYGEDLISAFERPLLTSDGRVAFEASTSGPWGVDGRGIWGSDRDGELHLVAHTGMEWEVAPGDRRTISLLKMWAGGSSDDGFFSAINDAGQIALVLNFLDGTEAVVVASIQPGDADADGDVDLADLNNVRNHFGGNGAGDTNLDGIVDLVDLNQVRNHFGEGAVVSPVPEPCALALAMIGGGLPLLQVATGKGRRSRR